MVIDIGEEMIPELFASLCQARGQAGQTPRTILEANRQADYGLVAAYIRPAGVAARALHMLQVLQHHFRADGFARSRNISHDRSARACVGSVGCPLYGLSL